MTSKIIDPLDPSTWRNLPGSCGKFTGVYAIHVMSFDDYFDKKLGDLVYIGASDDIRQRINTHQIYKKIDEMYPERYLTPVTYLETNHKLHFEKFLIKFLKPKLNIQHNG